MHGVHVLLLRAMFYLIMKLIILPSNSSSTRGFDCYSWILSLFSFLCLVHDPLHPFWLQLSFSFQPNIVCVSFVLCFPHALCTAMLLMTDELQV